jgi:catechol 2,3-dioxygenase-like lactoylglutathione lyase family enzyme
MSTMFHHFAITVSDLETSAAFYKEYFGLEEVSRNDIDGPELSTALDVPDTDLTALMLTSANCILELLYFRNPAGRPSDRHNSDVAAAHACFAVDDIAELHERMVAGGVDVQCPPNDFGETKYLFAKDPDGISVEVIQLGSNIPRAPLTQLS